MNVKVLNPLFYRHTGNQREVDVDGRTVAECLGDLARKYPQMEQHLFTVTGSLQPHILVSLNHEVIQHDRLDRPVDDGDEIHIMTMIEGG